MVSASENLSSQPFADPKSEYVKPLPARLLLNVTSKGMFVSASVLSYPEKVIFIFFCHGVRSVKNVLKLIVDGAHAAPKLLVA